MIGGPTSGRDDDEAHDDHAEHGEAVALEALPRVLPERCSDDGFVHIESAGLKAALRSVRSAELLVGLG